jgi:hypothetical protein
MDELTRQGRAVGPAHFTAYEMIRDPENADPLPADVFSLGKTLWALATEQEWPPLGHQPAASRGFLLSELRPHVHADALDRLIDRATRSRPEERPTMAELAADLHAWHELGQAGDDVDVSAFGARFRASMEHELAADNLLDQRKELALAHARRLTELLHPLNEALAQIHPKPEIGLQLDKAATSWPERAQTANRRHYTQTEVVLRIVSTSWGSLVRAQYPPLFRTLRKPPV